MRVRSERIVCPHGVVAGEVVVDGGRISSVGPVFTNPGGELVDVGPRWVVPGYIDGHAHGGRGAQCNTASADEIAQVARFHASHGTTGLLATPVPAPLDDLCVALSAIAECDAPNVLGAHLEGPFLSRRRPGALDADEFLDPDARALERLLAAGAGRIRLMTIAPELPGALDLVGRLVAAGIEPSIGHSDATDAEVREAVRAGATAATHLFNAMAPFHHREPGAVGAVLDLDEVNCELICDGVHVEPVAMRLVHRAKGTSGIRLVTDATAAAGMPEGEYRLGGRTVLVSGGRVMFPDSATLAGSTLTMEAAVQNAVRFLGIQIEDAVLMSSTNAARLLGLERRKGAIDAGFDADLLVLDELLAVQATMVAGQWVTNPP